jgi:hypothetical protein
VDTRSVKKATFVAFDVAEAATFEAVECDTHKVDECSPRRAGTPDPITALPVTQGRGVSLLVASMRSGRGVWSSLA